MRLRVPRTTTWTLSYSPRAALKLAFSSVGKTPDRGTFTSDEAKATVGVVRGTPARARPGKRRPQKRNARSARRRAAGVGMLWTCAVAGCEPGLAKG